MATYESLLELTKSLDVGDKVLWIGEYSIDGAGKKSAPNTVSAIHYDEDMIKVEGAGIEGGEYYYEVYRDGESRAYFLDPSKADEE
jgi:hypothetical protein